MGVNSDTRGKCGYRGWVMRMNEGQMGAGLAGEPGRQGSLPERPHLSTLLLALKCHKSRLATGLGRLRLALSPSSPKV